MRVCVVIPAYNEARNLPVLLPRVFAQAEFLPGWELSVLVVDDDSTDGTRAVLAEMQTRYPALYVL
ncbi:MAG TPA: glycosyltransferase, partial [Terriglobales bacterium]|nr:glycosyltransferase [Terriglobales bacterium]